jgi:hypothetical protein
MSKSKFIHVGDAGCIHVFDVLHDIFVKYLIDAAEEFDGGEKPAHAHSAWLAAEVESWRVCAAICDMSVSFDDGWSEDQRGLVSGLAERACAELTQRFFISAAEMRRWNVLEGVVGIEPRGEQDVPAASVVEVGRAVITLLRGGKIEPPAEGDWFYSTSGRQVWQRRLTNQ